jgi:hypothetical protein
MHRRISIIQLPIDGILLGLLLAPASLAFVNLLELPAFEDEGTAMRWIWRAIEAGEWLQPLSDGKPLQVWPIVPFVKAGVHPLNSMRTLNVAVRVLGSWHRGSYCKETLSPASVRKTCIASN